ncbi:MAG TPA: hypothetical protein VFG73_00530 [Rhodanobacteraceae bacterium]|nr:hypothetical protein [Rhodanobacteraceae bacterium]
MNFGDASIGSSGAVTVIRSKSRVGSIAAPPVPVAASASVLAREIGATPEVLPRAIPAAEPVVDCAAAILDAVIVPALASPRETATAGLLLIVMGIGAANGCEAGARAAAGAAPAAPSATPMAIVSRCGAGRARVGLAGIAPFLLCECRRAAGVGASATRLKSHIETQMRMSSNSECESEGAA